MKNRSKSQLEILKENMAAGKYVVAMSTNIDTEDKAILDAVCNFHRTHDIRLAERYAELFLRDLIDNFNLDYINSKGYYKGVENPSSYFIFTDKEKAKLFVENAASWFGQESIIAFSPNCSFEEYNAPVDYSTKLDNSYIVFNFDGEVLETPRK